MINHPLKFNVVTTVECNFVINFQFLSYRILRIIKHKRKKNRLKYASYLLIIYYTKTVKSTLLLIRRSTGVGTNPSTLY